MTTHIRLSVRMQEIAAQVNQLLSEAAGQRVPVEATDPTWCCSPASWRSSGCAPIGVRLIDGLGCKRMEQWLISRSTSTAMLLWFIAATNAQERQA